MFVYYEIDNIEPLFFRGSLTALSIKLKRPDDYIIEDDKLNEIYITIKEKSDLTSIIEDFILKTTVGFFDKNPDDIVYIFNKDFLNVYFYEPDGLIAEKYPDDILLVEYKDETLYGKEWSEFSSYATITENECDKFIEFLKDMRNSLIQST